MEKNETFKEELENQYSILIRANEKKDHQRYMVLLTIILVTFFTCLLTMFFSFKAFSSTKELIFNSKLLAVAFTSFVSACFALNYGSLDDTFQCALPGLWVAINKTHNMRFYYRCNMQNTLTHGFPHFAPLLNTTTPTVGPTWSRTTMPTAS